jgi:hypothetical protein
MIRLAVDHLDAVGMRQEPPQLIGGDQTPNTAS